MNLCIRLQQQQRMYVGANSRHKNVRGRVHDVVAHERERSRDLVEVGLVDAVMAAALAVQPYTAVYPCKRVRQSSMQVAGGLTAVY